MLGRNQPAMSAHTFDPLSDSRWDDLVLTHPAASVFHSRGWLVALQRTYGFDLQVFTTSSRDEHLMNGIRDLQKKQSLIGDVRGRGLMIGVELVRDQKSKERAIEERNALVQAMFRRGVLVLGAGRNAVRFAPPLVLSKAQADIVLRLFDESMTEVTQSHAMAGSASKGTAS